MLQDKLLLNKFESFISFKPNDARGYSHLATHYELEKPKMTDDVMVRVYKQINLMIK